MKIGSCVALVILAFVSANTALAQRGCAPRSDFVKYLGEKHSEAPVAHGLMNANDRLLELFASKDGKTWTLLATYPNGESCVVTAGHDWRETMPKLLKPTGQPI
jgi:hypothetical protein